MGHKTHIGWVAVIPLMMCAIPGYSEDVRLPPKIVKIEPVQARVEIWACDGPSVSLKTPKWKCDEEHHGDIVSAYRVTYVRGNQQFVTVLPYRPDEKSAPVEYDAEADARAGFSMRAVLRELK